MDVKIMADDSDRPQRRVTVVDVALAAGVSPGTVSNAISGKRKVDDATRDRVRDAITRLGYVPNLAARQMRTGRAGAIAIHSPMPTAVAAGASKLGFLMEVAASAAVTALEQNTALVLIPGLDKPGQVLGAIAMDGALLLEPPPGDPFTSALIERGVPVVIIGQPDDPDIPHVPLDYTGMAGTLVAHLVETGATRFPLIVGKSGRASNSVFAEGYLRETGRRGLPAKVIEIDEAGAEEGAARAVTEMIEAGEDFDGLIVVIDAMATGAMRALRNCGKSVPGDVRVVTRYDGVRARSETPPLTAFDLRLDVISDVATRMLIDLIERGESSIPRTPPPPILVVRGSSQTQS